MDDRCQLQIWNPSHILLSLLLIHLGLISAQQWDGVFVSEADYEALKALKHEFVDFNGVLSSWNDTGAGACSGWAGIKCVNGQVIAIQLPWKGLGGRISDKIGQLRALRRLSLHDNLLVGPVPTSLGFLPDLRGVYLFNNRLSGPIPPSIGNCLLLQTLDLSNNQLTGTLPSTLAKSTRLYRLNLSFNGLSGPIPTSLSQSPSLTFLALQHNNLSGPIPDTWGGGAKFVQNSYKLQFLALDHNSLSGKIPASLSNLEMLENLSMNHNQIVGIIPDELGNLSRLNFLDLSSNNLDGLIPESIQKLGNLSVLNLSDNKFRGQIPEAIGTITSIASLDLSENSLTGDIPLSLVNLPNLSSFDVSYNNLSGIVPSVLAKKFNSSSFIGNGKLCGYGNSTCPSLEPENLPSPPEGENKNHHHSRLSTKDIILVAAGALLVVLLLLCCVLICCLIRKKAVWRAKNTKKGAVSRRVPAMGTDVESSGETGGKLVHFDGTFVFTADDLLCATAEIMGKSVYGTAYKATLDDNNQVAVKRLREKITKSQKEFEIEITHLGKIRHPNILSLRAYYIGPKGEKLLVYDYMPNGSLASFLHARGPETSVPWQTRMAIVIGITRGLSYLHATENILHGNLTSSNVLLDEEKEARIGDVGLCRLMTSGGNTDAMATMGYRAPEVVVSKAKNGSTKADVFSLGVIILELLTGKSPSEAIDGVELPQWVASIVKEEWTNEVFDVEVMRDASSSNGDELLNVLKLGLHCVDPNPAARPEALEVLHKLEEIKLDSTEG